MATPKIDNTTPLMSSYEHNNFKLLHLEANLTPEDKKIVMDRIDFAKFLLDLADVFTVKQAGVTGTLIDALTQSNKGGSNMPPTSNEHFSR